MRPGYYGAIIINSLHQNNQKCMGLGYSGAKKSLHQNNQKCMGLGYFGAMHLYNPCLLIMASWDKECGLRLEAMLMRRGQYFTVWGR